jgi:hypothetical protein
MKLRELRQRLANLTTATGVVILLIRYHQVVCERDVLMYRLRELQDRYDQVPTEIRHQIARRSEQPYWLPQGDDSRVLFLPIGEVILRARSGDRSEVVISVYLPDGVDFSQEVADALHKGTKGELRMERATDDNNGGDNRVKAVISASAGPDGPAPRLNAASDVLWDVFSRRYGGWIASV